MDPIYAREKVVLLAIEAQYGVDANPGAASAVLAREFAFTQMEGTDEPRELDLPYMGDAGTVATGLHAKLSFKVELAPSGTAGTPPEWGAALRACGVAQVIDAGSSVTYNPVSRGHESAGCYFYNGDTLYKLLGMRGTCVLVYETQKVPMLEFEFTALYTPAAEGSQPTPSNFAAYGDPEEFGTARSAPVNLDGTDLATSSLRFNLGNTVEPRFVAGADAVVITSKSEMVETTVDAVPLTSFDPFAYATSRADVPLTLVHGKTPGGIATLTAPRAQMLRPGALGAAQNISQWPLRLKPRPATGNDQWTLTLT